MNHNSKILVTGGTGFLGAYIIKQLIEKGFAVRAIKRSTSKLPLFIDKNILEKVEWVEGDILDVISLEEAMRDIDTMIHAAAVVSFSVADRKQMYRVNIEGTANVVNMALETGVKRFIYISSVAALGRKKDSSVVDESAKWEDSPTNTHYAITKHKAEIEVWRGFAEGLEGVILNPATILGYGDWNDGSSAIFKSAYKEFGWYTNGINGFTDVEDVAKATVELMKSNITEERFIVCNDSWSFRKLFDTMAEAFGRKKPHREATPFLGGIAWRLEWIKSFFSGKKPLVTKESAKVANSETIFNGSKLSKTLPGFVYTPLETTIPNACRKYAAAAEKI
ncbi:MAG: 3-beta hydroxysteroid dehydrogenase [Sphingobacteriales bacterium 41-5]|nr:MAG: 3-beta hydroxysteroid dehydrogenase [Sphingobacteriales bacterium 41-5]